MAISNSTTRKPMEARMLARQKAVAKAKKTARTQAAVACMELRARWESVGVSQRELAAKANLWQPHLNSLLNGKVQYPTPWTLARVDKALTFFENKHAKQ